MVAQLGFDSFHADLQWKSELVLPVNSHVRPRIKLSGTRNSEYWAYFGWSFYDHYPQRPVDRRSSLSLPRGSCCRKFGSSPTNADRGTTPDQAGFLLSVNLY